MFNHTTRALQSMLRPIRRTVEKHAKRCRIQHNRLSDSMQALWICMFTTWALIVIGFIFLMMK